MVQKISISVKERRFSEVCGRLGAKEIKSIALEIEKNEPAELNNSITREILPGSEKQMRIFRHFLHANFSCLYYQ